MKRLLVVGMTVALFGCSGFCAKYNTMADYIDTAHVGLQVANTVYGKLLEAKYVPAMRTEATLALSAIDIAVPVLKAIIEGICKDPDVLNAAVFSIEQAAKVAQQIQAK